MPVATTPVVSPKTTVTNCPSRQTFVIGTPPTYGSPNPRYIKPLVRINGMTNDIPFGHTLNPCILPMDAIAEATNQTLSQTGNVVTLSDGGGSFTLPTDLDAQTLSLTGNQLSISNGNTVTIPVPTTGTEPTIISDANIPTDVVGTDDYLLAKPTAYLSVVVDGVTYNIPAY